MKTFLKIVVALIVLVVAVYGYIFYTGSSSGPKISERVTEFLQLASDGYADEAYEFFTKDLKKTWPIEKFENDLDDHFGWREFASQEQTGYEVNLTFSKYNYLGPTIFYEYQGIVTYTGNAQGDIIALFVKENGEWRLWALDLPDPYPIY